MKNNKAHPHIEGQMEVKDTPQGYTPQQMRNAYSYSRSFTGKGKKVAIICAFDNVAIEENMRVFCTEFSLPYPTMSLHYPFGKTEATDKSWRVESSLDTQWCHVFSPNAEMAVVFSPTSSIDDLLRCAGYASQELKAHVVNMSFGRDEMSDDQQRTQFFEQSSSVFVSSSGDVGGRVSFPSSSPYCISVGGTSLSVNKRGRRLQETAWQNGGGGASDIFDIPSWQGRFFNIYGESGGKRSTPDAAMNASFDNGVPVYDSESGGWLILGGTSLACACFSGVCACLCEANENIKKSSDALIYLYEKAGTDGYDEMQRNFYDVRLGSNGTYKAKKGYDFCTGLGTPNISLLLK